MSFFVSWSESIVGQLESWGVYRQTLSTVALVIAVVGSRGAGILAIRRWNTPNPEEKRRWIYIIKNAAVAILAIGLFIIWATELRAFALSLVAVAAAVALSLREIIQCVMGGFWKASVRPFEIGDRIEINGYRGEVMDQNLLCTTILEIGPQPGVSQLSGRQVVVPNSMFLIYPVLNQSIQQTYVLHTIRVALVANENFLDLERLLLETANRECAPFLDPARHAMFRLAQREGLDLPRVEPRVTFQYDCDGKVHATLRFPTPVDRVTRTEQLILRHVIATRGEHHLG
jgi:small-conductance mechanosensitive channel